MDDVDNLVRQIIDLMATPLPPRRSLREQQADRDSDRALITEMCRTYGAQCRRAGAEAMREAAAKVPENGSFLHDKSPAAIWAKQIASLIRALPSAAEAASPAAGWRVPDGWKLVPITPTEAMIEAGWIDKEDVDPDNIYCAMLDAAPSPSEEARAG